MSSSVTADRVGASSSSSHSRDGFVAGQDVAGRVRELQRYIQSGRILEAMEEFYASDVVMQENGKPPTVGLAANVEREKQFLAQVKQFLGYEVKSLNVGEGTSAVESVLEFINTGDQRVRLEQVAVQRWAGGKITHERFYYDTGA